MISVWKEAFIMSLAKAKKYLEGKGYVDHIIELEDSSATVELAAQALGVEPGMIAKTLSFLIGDNWAVMPLSHFRKIQSPHSRWRIQPGMPENHG